MKGLIIKDFYCLKKEVLLYLGTTIAVCVLSVLFVLSTKYGNIADAIADIQKTEMITAESLIKMTDFMILLAIVLPIALMGCITECFKADKKADYSKVLYSFPMNCKEIVGSRYLTCIIFSGGCIVSSVFCGIIISSVSETIVFTKLLGCIISFCAGFLIYMSLVMFLLYFFEAKCADIIQAAPLLLILFLAMMKTAQRVEQIADADFEREMTGMINEIRGFLEEQFVLLGMISVASMFVSYCLSVLIMKKKKEAV